MLANDVMQRGFHTLQPRMSIAEAVRKEKSSA